MVHAAPLRDRCKDRVGGRIEGEARTVQRLPRINNNINMHPMVVRLRISSRVEVENGLTVKSNRSPPTVRKFCEC